MQDPVLFTGTVRDNILCGRQYADGQAAEIAARIVQADEFISRLPQGFETVLGSEGMMLSVGQRQLLSFARALVADPRLLILDEATASVDSFTERDIQRGLKPLLQGRTCALIAHRLATVRTADEILVLEDGGLAERGTHDQLIRGGKLYKRFSDGA